MARWYTYILECADGSLYTGITTNLVRRLSEHNGSAVGAKYTRIRRPVVLRASRYFLSQSRAASEEARIKKLSRHEKLSYIETLDKKP